MNEELERIKGSNGETPAVSAVEGVPEDLPAVAESREQAERIKIGKKTLVLVAGLAGSGKSTFAETNFPMESIVSTDRIRQELTNTPRNQLVSTYAFAVARKIVEERLKNGEMAVVDAQNLVKSSRGGFYDIAKKNGANIEIIFLNVGPEESVKRDKARGVKTGERYIKSRRGSFEATLGTLKGDKKIDRFHMVEPEDTDKNIVMLPEDDRAKLEADKELKKEAEAAAAVISELEKNPEAKEDSGAKETIPVKAGSVIFIDSQAGEKTENFLRQNFIEPQILRADSIAKRLGTEITDEAVADVMKMILERRVQLNLTTAVIYPPEFEYVGELMPVINKREKEKKVIIETSFIRVIDGSEKAQQMKERDDSSKKEEFDSSLSLDVGDLEKYRIQVERDAPEDVPLLLVGDVHGCYKAMRELSSRVRQENISKKDAGGGKQHRAIVFLGDMADRGPYDAETVIYIASLVRSGRATLIKGNHDINLMKGLKGEEIRSGKTMSSIAELKKRLKPESIQKIIDMIDKAPYFAEWQKLVAVHAALPAIPRRGEELSEGKKHAMTHGQPSGGFTGGRAEVWKLRSSVAHDPGIKVVGGHTHEEEPVTDLMSGTTVLDGSAEIKGKLWSMYYPELELASAEEPSVVKMYEILKSGELPKGEDLLKFIDYARLQGFIDIKEGTGEYNDLILTVYSRITEADNTWEKYPMLRHFRGLIIDKTGNIVARPFEKTHKAGDEIPLEKLDMIPEKVFEKANGSMAIVYHWKGKWRVATKFSFENEDYTKPAEEMLGKMNLAALEPDKTYLFEIILPNDPHIVDYGGKKELNMLNAISRETGNQDEWGRVVDAAEKLGARTARDMTADFSGKTIAEIYRFAQTPGNLTNLEGLMAQYTDENGKKVTVKIKTKEYDDKKFVRDRLDWEDLIEEMTEEGVIEISPDIKEKMLFYNIDNDFAVNALESRIQWIKEEYEKIEGGTFDLLAPILEEASNHYKRIMRSKLKNPKFSNRKVGEIRHEARTETLQAIQPRVKELIMERKGSATQDFNDLYMSLVRAELSVEEPGKKFIRYALRKISERIEQEKKKRGKNSFWVLPV